jgi:hypothetical protein
MERASPEAASGIWLMNDAHARDHGKTRRDRGDPAHDPPVTPDVNLVLLCRLQASGNVPELHSILAMT